jgi:hypothetical protein
MVLENNYQEAIAVIAFAGSAIFEASCRDELFGRIPPYTMLLPPVSLLPIASANAAV